MKKMKIGTIILIVFCFIGLSLLLYPAVANFWNTHFATHAVASYVASIENLSENA